MFKTCKLINSTSKHCDLNPKIPWAIETKSTSKNNFALSNETQIFAPQIPTTFHLRTWKEIHILGFHLFQEKEREKETEKETERETEYESSLDNNLSLIFMPPPPPRWTKIQTLPGQKRNLMITHPEVFQTVSQKFLEFFGRL